MLRQADRQPSKRRCISSKSVALCFLLYVPAPVPPVRLPETYLGALVLGVLVGA